MSETKLTPHEWLMLKADAVADKLSEPGFMTDTEAKVYSYRSIHGISREATAEELGLMPEGVDHDLQTASEKIEAVTQTARILWSESEDWGKHDVEPIEPVVPTFVNSLRSEIEAAGHNPYGQVNEAYLTAYRAACSRAARDALDHGDHPCVISHNSGDVIYLTPDRDSWLDVFAAEWLPAAVEYDRVRRAHRDALNQALDTAPTMLRDATLRARVVEPNDDSSDNES